MEDDDFTDEIPTAVFIRPREVDELVESSDAAIDEEDLDPAAFCPMATRYPLD